MVKNMEYKEPLVVNEKWQGTIDCAVCRARKLCLKLNDFGICAKCYAKMPDEQRAVLENRQPQTVIRPIMKVPPVWFIIVWGLVNQALVWLVLKGLL